MTDTLPRWDVSDVHESFAARSFVDALERAGADADRLVALFDERGVGSIAPRPVTAADGATADAVIAAYNATRADLAELEAYVHATVSTDSREATAAGLASELSSTDAKVRPLLARLAAWVAALGFDALAERSPLAAEHAGPLRRLVARAEHQMPDDQEGLYAELATTGSAAWTRLHAEVTSQLQADVAGRRLPMAAVRGMATDADPTVRRAAYEAELTAWPSVAVTCAAALNGVKGEAVIVNRRRSWADPLDASLFANSVSRATFAAMDAAITAALPDFRSWMRTKARLHGHTGGLPWWDLVAPLPGSDSAISWEDGLGIVRHAFATFGGSLGGLVDRAVGERWIDAGPRDGKRGGAFCMSFVGDRSLVFLNWNGSVDAAQTTAHELGHAYHNTQLAQRTPLQRMLPMALAETASIFCETLVVDEGLGRLDGAQRLALLDVDLQAATQVVVDIRSRFVFETAVFAARQRRTLGVDQLVDLMLAAQAEAYGDGLDQSTAHPYMWAVKPHYYGSHFYNWPYTYGLLFGLGLFARYRDDPEAFRARYDDVLSRCGMATAEELAADFGFDVTDQAFWTASLDVLRERIAEHRRLAGTLGLLSSTRYEPDRDALSTLLAGEPRYRIDQVWHGLYDELAAPEEMTNLPKALRARLDTELPAALREVTRRVNDGGDTVKQLWSLDGGAAIESVLMLYPDRVTVCVSSQAGCAMGCGFCATGQAGFERHLSVGEIVEQVVSGAREARAMGRRLANVVFMGMGEPLANEANVWAAVERIHGGLGLSARHLTISTVGLVPGINRLAERPLPVNLAVSLHAANDELRNELVPINRRYPIDVLLAACAAYLEAKGRRLSFEWAMIDGVNDRDTDARELAALCRRLRLPAHVNLIPLNPTPGYPTVGSPRQRVADFRDLLETLGVNATVRRNRGTDIDAACGQLAAGHPVSLSRRTTR